MKSPECQTIFLQSLQRICQFCTESHQILQRARRIYLSTFNTDRFLIYTAKFFLWIFEKIFPGHFWDFSDFSILIFSGNSVKPLQHFDIYYRFWPCSFRCSKNFHPFFPFSARKISFGIMYYRRPPL